MAKPVPELLEVNGIEVKLSSPDKIYFPECAYGTKRDVVNYYHSMTAPLLAAMWQRPTFLQRFPDGIAGEEIYQKRLPPRVPEHVTTTDIIFPSGRGASVLKVTTAADIVWAANLGTITFHPWPTTAPDNEHPDQLRIDLDPGPGTNFDDARKIAIEIAHPLLKELGMTGFPKTSGNRGIHIYLPIFPEWDFIETRHAVIAFVREMERRAPALITTAWWKEERGERVFLDFNQNARDKTIASAYSVRNTAQATVSTPVTWEELVDVNPADCTIVTVPKLVAQRGDPMFEMSAQASSIAPLLEMWERDLAHGLGELPYPPNFPKMPGEPPRVQPSRAKK